MNILKIFLRKPKLNDWIYELETWAEELDPFISVRYHFQQFIDQHSTHFVKLIGVELTKMIQAENDDWHMVTLDTLDNAIKIHNTTPHIYPFPEDSTVCKEITAQYKEIFHELYGDN